MTDVYGGGCVATSLHDEVRNFPLLERMRDSHTCGSPLTQLPHIALARSIVSCMRAGRGEVFLNTSSSSETST